jgi:uncharacterized sulfatase
MPDRPNVVLFLTDSQGWNALGECGEGFATTPTIDGLADDGVCFDRSYITAPTCTPSRAGLVTGRHPHDAGAWTNNLRLYQGVETMGQHFQRAGYRTAWVGKWHLDGDYFGHGEAPPGYDEAYWYDGQNYREHVGEERWEWFREGMSTKVSENPIEEIHERDITREDTWAGGITDNALAFLDDAADDDRPYFLVVSYDEPHEPSLCPPPYCDSYVGEHYPLPENHEAPEDLAANGKPERQQAYAEAYDAGDVFMDSISDAGEDGIYRPLYFGCAEFVDSEIGCVLESIDGDESVVGFASDHGHYLGAHGLDLKHLAMYDEVTNVPLVLRGPGVAEGQRTDALVSLLDLLPTFLDVAGAEVPDAIHGQSFWDVARDPGRDHRETALIEYHSYARGRTGRDGFYPVRCLVDADGHKLVINREDRDEFYDQTTDPGELDNRIDDAAVSGVRDDLHDSLLETMRETSDPFHGDKWRERPWRDAV